LILPFIPVAGLENISGGKRQPELLKSLMASHAKKPKGGLIMFSG